MKLKGEVEVFKVLSDGTSHSVLKEGNMVVDGASEVIVDMLTTPLFIKNTTGSASLDPSNFIVNAVTLGKAEKLYGGSVDMSSADTDEIGMHAVFNNVHLSAVYTVTAGDVAGDEWVGGLGPASGVSSFSPSVRLPKDPTPRDQKLENSSKSQIAFYYENSSTALSDFVTGSDSDLSAYNPTSATLLEETGHNLNALYGRTVKNIASLHQGCYAPSDGIDIRVFFGDNATRSNIESGGPAAPGNLLNETQASSNDVSGRYNTVGSMDQNGYLVAYPTQNHPDNTDTTQGVAVSAGTTSSLTALTYTGGGLLSGSSAFIQSPAVVHTFSVSAPDLLCLAAYKGFTNIGLWALDAAETFKTEAAPVAWSTPTNNRKYKLFAKKVFSEDLTTITDDSAAGIANYSDLKVEWRMNFSFGETF